MTISHTLADPRVETALDRMFAQAEEDDAVAARLRAERPAGFGTTPQEYADAVAEIYMPISRTGGELLYNLVRSARPATVVEFGMSYGISTLYLAAAVRDN